jgi:hypothetical protein
MPHHLTIDGGKRRLMIAALRYTDTFVKIDGAWLFAERRSTSTGSKSAHCHDSERSGGGPETPCNRGRDGNGRRIRPSLRARAPAVGSVTVDRAQEARHLAPQAERGSASRLRGLLRTRGDALGSGRSGLLPGHVYGSGVGRGAPHHNRGLHDRVRASSPREQPRRGVLILERERRGPDGTKSDSLRTLQGRGRERATRGGVSRVYIFRPAYIYPVEPRKEPNFSYRLLRAIYPAFRILFPNQVIRADDLARAMVDVTERNLITSRAQPRLLTHADEQRLVGKPVVTRDGLRGSWPDW